MFSSAPEKVIFYHVMLGDSQRVILRILLLPLLSSSLCFLLIHRLQVDSPSLPAAMKQGTVPTRPMVCVFSAYIDPLTLCISL